ncbi:hypothetical protein C0991_000948 [Blastosporella zonata]|nr:hypothetical protein C0991_000948 [Blastosporella zonata]
MLAPGSTHLRLPIDQSSLYADSRSYGIYGPTKNVRLYRATPGGGGAMSQSEDGLRILLVSDGSVKANSGHKSSVGRGGYRIDASRNLWEGSGLKIDSASTDVAWGHGVFNNKILTSARNGELIMWDINKAGPSKYERRSKDHLRSINATSVSHIVHHYCITGSADGDMRVWDLRDMTRSLMRVHHPTSVRSVVFSPSNWQPLHAIVGLDNGSIHRWDLKMGQRGNLDKRLVAHSACVTSLDWCTRNAPNPATGGDPSNSGMGWLVSGGLDRCVKVWDLTAPGVTTPMPVKPLYTLHPSFPVRRVMWRPGYECELAVVSNAEFSSGSSPDLLQAGESTAENKTSVGGDAVEIWDVRRAWIPKWSVTGSAIEGGVTGQSSSDELALNLLTLRTVRPRFQHPRLDLDAKPLDAVTSTAATWESSGSLAFAADAEPEWQIPYDDIPADRRALAEKQHIKVKAIGDGRYAPTLQDVGMFNPEPAGDSETFSRLARGYVFHGKDRPMVCATNARVAFQAQREELAQTWLLLGAALADLAPTTTVPENPSPTKATSSSRQSAPHSHAPTSPALTPSTYSFPASASTPSQLRKPSPNHAVVVTPRSASTSTSRKITPVSSNASSPRQAPVALPSTTPRRPSIFASHRNGDSDFSRRSSISMYRRPSISLPGSQHSLSPADKNSLRHVGEGALDDSDSSSPEDSDDEMQAAIDHPDLSSDEEGVLGLLPLLSPGFLPNRGAPAPSPLSRVAGQHQWTEDEAEGKGRDRRDDEDDSSSPSPRSTDTDSPGPSGSTARRRKASKSGSRSVRRRSSMKSRSRSSTVASLAAAPAPPVRSLTRQDSHSSILTVLAGDGPAVEGGGLGREETVRDINAVVPQDRQSLKPATVRSELFIDPPDVTSARVHGPEIDPAELTERHVKLVSDDERRLHSLAWMALREALERFADGGNIQMCAMLSVVAPQELEISERRATRFLESYIGAVSTPVRRTFANTPVQMMSAQRVWHVTSLVARSGC